MTEHLKGRCLVMVLDASGNSFPDVTSATATRVDGWPASERNLLAGSGVVNEMREDG